MVVLYTDGITEAENADKQQYGEDRLCEVVAHCYQLAVEEIKQAIVADVQSHIGEQKLMDDITLLVLKQKLNGNNGQKAMGNNGQKVATLGGKGMVQKRGNFKEVLPPTPEYLRLSFAPHYPGITLEKRWDNNKLSAKFLFIIRLKIFVTYKFYHNDYYPKGELEFVVTDYTDKLKQDCFSE